MLLAAICLAYIVARPLSTIAWTWFRQVVWPKYPRPFKWFGKELINELTGNSGVVGGSYQILEKGYIETKGFFIPPIAFRLIAKTNSTNLRIGYAGNFIFNWEKNYDHLRLDDGPLGSAHDRDQSMKRTGRIPLDEWVVIDLVVRPTQMELFVNGDRRFLGKADFSKINDRLSIFQSLLAILHVKSIRMSKRLRSTNSI